MGSTKTADPSSWKQVSPTRYERELATMEKVYKWYGTPSEPYGRINAMVTTIVGYRSPRTDIISIFEKAWGYLHARFPHFAAQTDGIRRSYDIEKAEEVKKSSFVVVEDKTVRQVFPNLSPIRHPMLYVFPEEQQLMVQCPHDVSDGRGQFLFYKHFFETVQSITEEKLDSSFENATVLSRLAPSFDTVTGKEVNDDLIQEAVGEFGRMAKLTDGIHSHNVGDYPPGNACWQDVEFSERETSDILRSIKARGATVTPVTHAAIIKAQHKYTGQETPYFGSLPTDVRRYCGKEAENPLTVYLGLTMRLVPPGTFEETVDYLVKAYSTVHQNYESGLMQAFGQVLSATVETEAAYEPLRRDMVDLTSPGKVDDYVKPFYGDLEIMSFKQQPNEQFYGIFMSLLSFRGRLHASISYNDHYRKPEEMQQFARMFKEELLVGLEVEKKIDSAEPYDA